MVTCHIKYIIDPDKLEAFEHYARLWIPLVNKFGGRHHGCFLPSEGANNMALALFTEALNESILDSFRARCGENAISTLLQNQ